jgi:hypothetical protein
MTDAGTYIKFIQGSQKLIDESRKMIHLGMINPGFTALYYDCK